MLSLDINGGPKKGHCNYKLDTVCPILCCQVNLVFLGHLTYICFLISLTLCCLITQFSDLIFIIQMIFRKILILVLTMDSLSESHNLLNSWDWIWSPWGAFGTDLHDTIYKSVLMFYYRNHHCLLRSSSYQPYLSLHRLLNYYWAASCYPYLSEIDWPIGKNWHLFSQSLIEPLVFILIICLWTSKYICSRWLNSPDKLLLLIFCIIKFSKKR